MVRLSVEEIAHSRNGEMQIANLTKRTELAWNASAASTFWQRLIGLLGRRSLPAGEALLLQPCRSVHTLFMCFAIDLV